MAFRRFRSLRRVGRGSRVRRFGRGRRRRGGLRGRRGVRVGFRM